MSSRKIWPFLFTLVLIFTAAEFAEAQITDLHFVGTATYQIGTTFTPLSGIHVDLLSGGNTLGSTTTDSNGNFEIVRPLDPNCTPSSPPYEVNLTSPTWSFQGAIGFAGCQPPGIYDFGNVIMIRILSVVLEDAYASQTSINPNTGGGARIYPDKKTPSDSVNRRKINVRIFSTVPRSVLTVYYKVFDLDDPSDNVAPVDTNGSAGDDNRGTNSSPAVNTLQSILINPLASGLIAFTTTMQPGDNFVIVASTKLDYINGITVDGINLKDANGNIIAPDTGSPEPALRTQMLTVWRRLHIETDSMGQSQNNYEEGTVPNTVMIRRLETTTITLAPNNTLEMNRFEGGRLLVNGNSLTVTCSVINSINCNTSNTVRVQNTGMAAVTISANAPFTLYDDDDLNNDDGNFMDGDTGEDIPMPDTSLITGSDNPSANVFAPAYITPVHDIGDSNTNVTFVANTTADTAVAIRNLFDFDQIATDNAADFWTAYLLGGYQYVIAEDEDPDVIGVVTLGITDVQNGQGSVVFLETNGPKECDEASISCNAAATAAHEIGHLLNADDGDGGIMDTLSLSFSPVSLNKIRSSIHS